MRPNVEVIQQVQTRLKRIAPKKGTELEEMLDSYITACQISRIKGPRTDAWKQKALEREMAIRERLGLNDG